MLNQSVITAVLALLLLSTALAAPEMREYDRSTKNRAGLKRSDVCLSYRFFRKEKSPQDVLSAWKPARIEWSYVTVPEVIKAFREAGVPFVGTLNTIAFDGPEQDGVLFDGTRMVAPWMAAFNAGKGVGWACVNKQVTLPRRVEHLAKFISQGVDTIQHDDWLFNLHAVFWGGCFCGNCRVGFAEYLAANATSEDAAAVGVKDWQGFDYLAYLKDKLGRKTTREYLNGRGSDPLARHFRMFQLLATRDYFEKLLAAGRQTAGKPINLTVNGNTTPASLANNFLLDVVDYLVGETRFDTQADIWELVYGLKMADAVNLPQILSPFPRSKPVVRSVRRAIALTYALGHRMLVPWDVYVGSDTDRWFGTVEEYGDLYGFVRSNAASFDGFAPTADVVITVPISYDLGPAKAAGRAVRYLMRAGYTCRFAAYGSTGEIVHVPVNASDFAGVTAVVRVIPAKPRTDDEEALTRAIGSLPTVELSQSVGSAAQAREVCRRVAGVCAPSYRTDASNVLVLPRVCIRSGRRAIHLVNLAQEPRQVNLWLSERAVGSELADGALLLRPGKPIANLGAEASSGGVRISGIELDQWAIIVTR